MFVKRLMLPISNDPLLRVVCRRSHAPPDLLKVIGNNNCAWRRNYRYADIVCDLGRRQIVTFLPCRKPATAQARFAAYLTIGIVARDRDEGYDEAAATALPHVAHVANR